jgi:hypothetical protein
MLSIFFTGIGSNRGAIGRDSMSETQPYSMPSETKTRREEDYLYFLLSLHTLRSKFIGTVFTWSYLP